MLELELRDKDPMLLELKDAAVVPVRLELRLEDSVVL